MGTKREGGRRKSGRIDPAPRLFMVLVRHSLGWFEQARLAAALEVAPSLISMWEGGERPIPREALEETAAQANISRPLLALALRAIRSFLHATRGRGRGDRGMEIVVALDLLPVLLKATDILLGPLRSTADDPAEAEALWAYLERRTAAERLLLVEEGEEYQTRALHERVLAESAALAAEEPRQAEELAQLAARIAELAA
jgi:transcriptional regulator with XRE-family HTH domain